MQRPLLRAVILGLFGAFASASPAQAHSIGELSVDEVDDYALGRSAPMPAQLEAFEKTNPRGAVAARGVLSHFKLWPLGKTLRVCFLDGDAPRKKLLVDTMMQWIAHANLKLDFGAAPDYAACTRSWDAHIRVTFKDKGSWAFVGTDAQSITDRSRATFAVAVNSDKPFEQINRPYFVFTVLHEAGHALGLEHEHQSPTAKCDDEFDWTFMKDYLGQRGWDAKKVEFNMRAMVAGPRLTVTPYDRKSVMHYSLPPLFFREGRESRCFVPLNVTLSDGDKTLIARAYPKTTDERVANLRDRAAAASATLSAEDKPMQGGVLRAFASALSASYALTETQVRLRFDLRPGAAGRSLGPTKPCGPAVAGCRVARDDSALVIGDE